MTSNPRDTTSRREPAGDGRPRRPLAVAVAALLLVPALAAVPATTGAASSHDDPTAPSLVVQPQPDGDVELALTLTYDLTTQSERDAFLSLEQDRADQQALLERFASRLRGVADQVSQRTGRTTTVTASEVSTERSGDVGAIHLAVTWTNLAVQRDDSLVLTEPFASGFESERPVTVVAPDGYSIEDASPAPHDRSGSHATWNPGTSLDGFEVSLSESGGNPLPGFGGVAAVVAALLGAGLLARRRRGR